MALQKTRSGKVHLIPALDGGFVLVYAPNGVGHKLVLKLGADAASYFTRQCGAEVDAMPTSAIMASTVSEPVGG